MVVSLERIKELREATGISISECKKALEEAGNDIEKAKTLLREWGKEVAGKKKDREVGQGGLVVSYVHGTGKVGSLVAITCETDFVARSDDFQNLCHELALQVVSVECETVDELLVQPYIRDASKTVGDLIVEAIAKLGENIVINKFARFTI